MDGAECVMLQYKKEWTEWNAEWNALLQYKKSGQEYYDR